MKEFEVKAQIDGEGLTKPIGPSTLEGKGNIFMPEPGTGDRPSKQSESKPVFQTPKPKNPTTPIEEQFNPEIVNMARMAWEELNSGRVVSVDERRTQNDLIARGLMPKDVLSILHGENAELGEMTAYEEDQAEEARRAWERYNQQGLGPPIDEELQEMLIAWGQEPPPGGIPPLEPPGPPFGGGEGGGTPEGDDKWIDALKRATTEGNFDEVDDLINKNLDLGDPYAGPKIKALAEISLSDEAIASKMYGYHLEYAMERAINQSDITPTDDYVQFTYYQQENLARIILTSRDFDKSETKDFYKYLSRLKNKRYIAHELFRSIKNREQYKEVISRYLRTEGFNFLENEIVGVPTTQMLWEKVLAHKVAGKKEWLDGEDFMDAHEEVGEMFKKRNGKKSLQKTTIINGQQISRDVRPWEIDRAIIIGRVVAAATQRRTSYGVLGEVPDAGEQDTLFKSLDSEYIARVIAGRKIIGQRFLAEGSGASKKYMELWRKHTKKIGALKGLLYGYKNKAGGENGLYGHSTDSWVLLESGVPDIKSHSWRSTLMFLKEREYAVVNAGNPDLSITIGDYFDDVLKSIKEGDLESVLSGLSEDQRREELTYINDPNLQLINKKTRIKNVIFSSKVSEVALSQRLYLGTLVRHGNLTPRLKSEIWKNVSKYLPSRIAAFFPNERREIIGDEQWNNLIQKLWIAEEMRVEAQAERVKNNDFTEEILEDHYGEDITDEERRIIREITDLGNGKAGDLGKMVWPFSPFLDDVPKTGWMEGEEADLERLLVSDHDNLNSAVNQEMAGVIANPAMRPAESAEHLKKAMLAYSNVVGPEAAQERLEADVLTRCDLYAMRSAAKWYGYSIMRFLRKPTSLIEEYNVDAGISMDEEATARDLELLAQYEVIGNDTTHRDALGFTQLDRIKERSKAGRIHIWLMYIRLLIALLPAEMAKEFMKILIPGDFAKSLG